MENNEHDTIKKIVSRFGIEKQIRALFRKKIAQDRLDFDPEKAHTLFEFPQKMGIRKVSA